MIRFFIMERIPSRPLGAMLRSRSESLFRARQNGAVLFIALIVLVAMTLAGIALIRSVDTGTMVAGNLAFKQTATMAGDAGTNAAIAYLAPINGTTTPYQNQIAAGYYATSQDNLDMTGAKNNSTLARVDWDRNSCSGITFSACIQPSPEIVDAATGNAITFIIHRLCQSEGDPNNIANTCATFKSTSGTSPKRGEFKYGDDKRFEPLPAVYYRITSRVKGPRNTVSYTETIVHF